jgi:hypothetical protein
MSIDRYKIWLSRYLDGDLDEVSTSELREHLSECSECTAALEGLAKYRSMASKVEKLKAPTSLIQKVESRIKEMPAVSSRRPGRSVRMIRILSVAAAAVLAGFLLVSKHVIVPPMIESDFTNHVVKRGKGPGETRGKKGSETYLTIENLATQTGGQIIYEEVNKNNGKLDWVVVKIPVNKYNAFRDLYNTEYRFDKLPDSPPRGWNSYLRIKIYLSRRQIFLCDINGDQYDDILFCFSNGKHAGKCFVALNDELLNFKTPQPIDFAGNMHLYGMEIILPGDYNGDGYDDILVIDNRYRDRAGWRIFLNDQNAGVYPGAAFHSGDSTNVNVGAKVFSGDFNGDGFDDIARFQFDTLSNEYWQIAHNNRSGSFLPFVEYSWLEDNSSPNSVIIPFVADINGDGYDDACVYRKGGRLYATWMYHPNSQEGSFLGGLLVRNQFGTRAWQGEYSPYPGDFNGDGYTDILVRHEDPNIISEWHYMINLDGESFITGMDIDFGDAGSFRFPE